MAWQTFSESNLTGIDGMLAYTAQTVNIFTPMLLISLWIIVAIGSYMANKRMFGKEDFLGSCTVASIMVTVIAFVMSIIPGLINTFEIGVCLAVSAIFLVIFMQRD